MPTFGPFEDLWRPRFFELRGPLGVKGAVIGCLKVSWPTGVGGMARGTFGTILADSVTFGVSRRRNRAEQVTTFSELARRFHHHHMVNSACTSMHRFFHFLVLAVVIMEKTDLRGEGPKNDCQSFLVICLAVQEMSASPKIDKHE